MGAWSGPYGSDDQTARRDGTEAQGVEAPGPVARAYTTGSVRSPPTTRTARPGHPRADYPGTSIHPSRSRSEMAVNLVNVEAVTKVYGTRALLDGVSLGVSEGDRIGVVGRNGDGKTTLIRMLAKLEEADTGRVTHSGGLRLGVLTQHDSLDPAATVRHEVIGDLADHEWAGDAKIRDVLTGLFGGLDMAGFAGARHRHRAAVRWRAAPDRAREAAHRRAGRDRPRRADQPSRRRGHLLARPASA